MISFMKLMLFILFLLQFTACTKKSTDFTDSNPDINLIHAPVSANKVEPLALPLIAKPVREAVYFSSSLEIEALKLITKNNTLQKNTLFSVLNYILETQAGVKKSLPMGIDCGKYELVKQSWGVEIYKTCVKPKTEVIRFNTIEEGVAYKITFLTKEWPEVLGLSASLTLENIVCALKIKNKKINSLNCENWGYQTLENQQGTTILKTSEFNFNREAEKQFVIKGGFFKDLVENKKINITVPIQGKIKIFEKEIKVIDEFADKINQELHEASVKNNEPINADQSTEVSVDQISVDPLLESADNTRGRRGR